ncbi:hypothetical protein PRIPAC_86159 [Pristionchus pacificus]|uniref:Protein kinase domain-containing protein n=1 Tax=Pristionchus pacificus TaxID=54126 RepID=A0A2A6BUN9_PRIPA|nr:hypothetical protein PRIPAC_86159 [Pristionchus pacificus]|eukprot:PDM69692.1 protein kinase [Pristionchus pacificus]
MNDRPPQYVACLAGMVTSVPPTGWCFFGGLVGVPFLISDAEDSCMIIAEYPGYDGTSVPSIKSAQIIGTGKMVYRGVDIQILRTRTCDFKNDTGHFFNTDGKWEKGQPTSVDNFVCSRKQEVMPTVETTSAATDLTDHLSSLGTHTAIESSTAAHLMTVADTTTIAPPETTTTPNIGFPPWGIVAISAVAIYIIVTALAIIFIVWRRFRRLKTEIVEVQKSGGKVTEDQGLQATRYYNLPNNPDGWEIERRYVSIDYMHKLGEGAFGSVYLGRVLAKNIPIGMGRSIAELYELTNNNDTVAVKRLHETADSVAERDFRAEIDLMKAIGFHDRLVNILACVTVNEPILLIVEYCANGDLLEFLRERRNYLLENPDSSDNAKTMNVKKQIMFAVPIAYGLEYLSSQGFVHRDIAARNIMGGKLPLKWMSPEAIDNYQFSVASDVWSYGVLLFEIVTLGGTPYAGWPASELLHRLKRGERMERPDNCSENMFDVMSHCWIESPSERPRFTKLRKRLGVLLEDVNEDDYYLKLNAQANYYVLESNPNTTTVSTDQLCDPEWIWVDDICYFVNTTHVKSWEESRDWRSVNSACSDFDAKLPIILSEEQNNELLLQTSAFFSGNKDIIQFWIGLIYTNEKPIEYNSGFAFLEKGDWYEYGRLNQAELIVCSKPMQPWEIALIAVGVNLTLSINTPNRFRNLAKILDYYASDEFLLKMFKAAVFLNDFNKKLAAAENAKNPTDRARVGCMLVFCHFEDKNGCRTQCNSILTKSEESKKVCSSLCEIYFSYTDWKEY